MKHRIIPLATAGIWFGLSAMPCPVNAAPILMGTDFDGFLYNIDSATGQADNPRNTGITTLNGIAFSPDGDLFAHESLTNMLLRIETSTGTPTTVGPIGLDVTEGDLDFHPTTGVLYGIQTFGADRLYTLNTTTGQGTVVGIIVVDGDSSAMAFDADNTLYVLDTRNELLYTVDPANANILTTVSLSLALGNAAGMDFDPESGLLYVADGGTTGTNMLYTLDPANGALGLIGDTGLSGGLSGLEFIPEPATLCLLAPSVLLFRRRRASRRGR